MRDELVCEEITSFDSESKERTFLYIQRKARPSSAQPTVARAQNTPATMWPPAKREMRLMSPAEPELGMPMNLERPWWLAGLLATHEERTPRAHMYAQKATWKPPKIWKTR